jgi:hypothetical protein
MQLVSFLIKKQKMKKLTAIILISFLFACKKDTVEQTTTVIVKEYNTQIPIAGAQVTLLKCAAFFCIVYNTIYTTSTNANGDAQIPQSKFNEATEGMQIYKKGYWLKLSKGGINYLNPEGWISLRLLNTRNYPPGSYLDLSVIEERRDDPYGSRTYVRAPVDSIALIKAYGAQLNTIKWRVYDAANNVIRTDTSIQVQVSKTDTTRITLNY